MSYSASLSRAQSALWWTFGIMGVVSMAWIPRIPEIKDQLGLNNSQFGILLIGSTCGSFVGAQISGRLVHIYGSRRVSFFAAIGMPAGLIAMGLSQNSPQLFLALFLMGCGYSSLDISVNAQAVAVEKLLQRRRMSSFHAMWSSGALLATTLVGQLREPLLLGST